MRTLQSFYLLIAIVALAVLLTACGGAATAPVPLATVTQAAMAPTTVASSDVAATLKSQLIADAVLANTVTLTNSNPAVLTIDYQFNDKEVAHTQLDVGSLIAVETERVVTATSKRVVAQVNTGAKIDQVVLSRHLAKGDTAFIQRINVLDMQAWSAGRLSTEAYRTRWCCNNAPDSSASQASPTPSAQSPGGYSAPAVQSSNGYPAAP